MIGLMNQFRAQPSPFDEDEIRDELKKQVDPREYTRIMAERKAQALPLAGGCQEEMESSDKLPVIVIGSDTIVDLDGTILEKPRSEEEAVEMLRKISGRKHQVHTGVALYSSVNQFQDPVSSFTETAQVEFAQLSEADIAAYVSSGEPMDKAGSYGIQGM